jgi:hypothetical protein
LEFAEGTSVNAASLQSSILPSHQNHRGRVAHKKAPQNISSALSSANSKHILPASAISPKTEKDFTAKEVAHLLGKHVATIYRWFESVQGVTLKKNSESVVRGNRRYWGLMVPQSVLIRFIDEHSIKIPISSS